MPAGYFSSDLTVFALVYHKKGNIFFADKNAGEAALFAYA